MTRTQTPGRRIDLATSVEGFRFAGPVDDQGSGDVMGQLPFSRISWEPSRSQWEDPSSADWGCELEMYFVFYCCSPAPFPGHERNALLVTFCYLWEVCSDHIKAVLVTRSWAAHRL